MFFFSLHINLWSINKFWMNELMKNMFSVIQKDQGLFLSVQPVWCFWRQSSRSVRFSSSPRYLLLIWSKWQLYAGALMDPITSGPGRTVWPHLLVLLLLLSLLLCSSHTTWTPSLAPSIYKGYPSVNILQCSLALLPSFSVSFTSSSSSSVAFGTVIAGHQLIKGCMCICVYVCVCVCISVSLIGFHHKDWFSLEISSNQSWAKLVFKLVCSDIQLSRVLLHN